MDTKSWTLAADFHFAQRGTPVFRLHSFPTIHRFTASPVKRSFAFTADGEKHTIWSSPSPVSVSPDQKILAARSAGRRCGLWDLASGQKLRTSRPTNEYHRLVIQRGRRWLLTGGQETPARLPSIRRPDCRPSRRELQFGTRLRGRNTIQQRSTGSVPGAASFSLDSRILIVEKRLGFGRAARHRERHATRHIYRS